MQPSSQQITYDQFSEWVQDALNHLYDSTHLQKHPLLAIITPTDLHISQRVQLLRRYLLDAIEKLRPEPGTPAQSLDWRRFRILEMRYIEALSVAGCLDELALGRSQFYRDYTSILKQVVGIIWQDWLEQTQAEVQSSAKNGEITRFAQEADWQTFNLSDLLQGLNAALMALAASHGMQLTIQVEPFLTIQGNQVLARQTILNLASMILELGAGDQVSLRGFNNTDTVNVTFSCLIDQPVSDLNELSHFGNCQRLMNHMKGTITVHQEGQHFQAALLWPADHPATLLIVDDNVEYVNLLKRYLANCFCNVIAANNGAEARELVSHTTPDAIILDIMLPTEDGWDLLTWFRDTPKTAQTPVIISSVICDYEMAVALGADDYLPKQVDAELLLSTLSKWHIDAR